MSTPEPTLLDTLHVLDLADQARAGTLTREKLIASTQVLNTGHTTRELELAADAYLAKGGSNTVASYDFGWDRPNSPEALEQARNRFAHGVTRPFNWIVAPDASFGRFCLWLAPFVLAWAVLAFCLHLGLLTAICGGMLALLGGSFAGLALTPIETWRQRLSGTRLSKTWLTKLLTVPSTRAYLQAVIQSGVPLFLNADQERLTQLFDAHQKSSQEDIEFVRQAFQPPISTPEKAPALT